MSQKSLHPHQRRPSPRFSGPVVNPFRMNRMLRGLRQSDLAALVGVPQTMISGIEIGKIKASPNEQKRIARALGVPAETLFPAGEKKS